MHRFYESVFAFKVSFSGTFTVRA